MSDFEKEHKTEFEIIEMISTEVLVAEILARTTDGVVIYKEAGKPNSTMNVMKDGVWLDDMSDIVFTAVDMAYQQRHLHDKADELQAFQDNDNDDDNEIEGIEH